MTPTDRRSASQPARARERGTKEGNERGLTIHTCNMAIDKSCTVLYLDLYRRSVCLSDYNVCTNPRKRFYTTVGIPNNLLGFRGPRMHNAESETPDVTISLRS